ncbi:MAG: hypothetical protein COA33_000080 [Fluviicola sp.]|nr:hypothetical protein [Fluviicola sp.]
MKIVLIFLFALVTLSASSQIKHKAKLPSYFGIRISPIFPTQFIGEKTLSMQQPANDPFKISTTITQTMGYSFGGTVRAGLTKLLAIETGLNFTKRNFDLTMELPDSSIRASNTLEFIQYDLPVNALFYIQLSKKWYMDASLGLAGTFSPTHVGVVTVPQKKQEFRHTGIVQSKFGLDLNANLGFEFRTEKKGFFYLGGSARVPFKPLFNMYLEYNYTGSTVNKVLKGEVDGSYLAIELKYFFPIIKNKGVQFNDGPIVQ